MPPWPKLYCQPVATSGMIGDMKIEVVELWIRPVYASRSTYRGFQPRYKALDNALQIVLRITNTNATKRIRYKSWRPTARAIDNHGNKYVCLGINPNGGLGSWVMFYPGQVEQEVLVFEVPVETAKTHRVFLPNAAVGIEGTAVLTIDLSKVYVIK